MSNNKQSEIPEDTTVTPESGDSGPGVMLPEIPKSRIKKPRTTEPDTPNANQRVEVVAGDLPLHCPMPGKRLWDSHPRVYLPIEDSGEEICPYCGTVYVMKVPAKPSH